MKKIGPFRLTAREREIRGGSSAGRNLILNCLLRNRIISSSLSSLFFLTRKRQHENRCLAEISTQSVAVESVNTTTLSAMEMFILERKFLGKRMKATRHK